MTSSIVITDTVNIEFDKKHKFLYTDAKTNETYEFEKEEIPVVRYRFKHYGINELNYIKNSLVKFDYSAHIAEVNVDDDCINEIKLLSSLNEVAIFIYIDLYKENIVTKSFNDHQRNILNLMKEKCLDKVERIMLRDKDGVLHMLIARPLIKSVSSFLGVKEDKIGYCSCAFSANGLCCLTAERARDIAARYSNNEHFAIATNVVEGKNLDYQTGCHCIRHILIEHDVENVNKKEKEFKISHVSDDILAGKMNSPLDEDYSVEGQLKYDGEKVIEEKPEKKQNKSQKKKLKKPKGAVSF